MVIVANNTTAQKPLDKKPVKEEKKAESKKDKK
jgi:hypothetical protein